MRRRQRNFKQEPSGWWTTHTRFHFCDNGQETAICGTFRKDDLSYEERSPRTLKGRKPHDDKCCRLCLRMLYGERSR